MTAGLALIALTGLALTTPAAASEPIPRAGEYTLTDVLVSSVREGRVVATGRSDARGNFRFSLPVAPSGVDQICLNGSSVRSAIERVEAGDPERARTVVIVIAVNDRREAHEERLVLPASRTGGGQRDRSADLDLCYRPFVNTADAGSADGIGNPDGANSHVEVRRTGPSAASSGNGPASGPNGAVGNGSRLARDRELPERDVRGNSVRTDSPPAPGDVNGDGRLSRTDPRIPPPDARGGPGGSAGPRPAVVSGSIRVVN